MFTSFGRQLATASFAAGVISLAGLSVVLAQTSDPIRIGVVQTLSGPAGNLGKEILLGAQIAVDHANSNGGVLGRNVELVIRDDKGTPADALSAARELSSAGINLILGSSTSAPALAVLPILESLGLVWMMPGGTSLAFTHDLFTRHYFHSTSNAYMYYYTAGKMLAERYPDVTKWAAIVADLAATQQMHSLFQRGLRDGFAIAGKKLELVSAQTSKFGAPDYRNQISAIRNSGAEGLLLGLVGGDAMTFLQQGRGFGLQNQIKVYFDGTNGLELGKALRQNTPNNIYSPLSWNVDSFDNPASRAFDAEAKKRSGDLVSSSQSAQGHTGITSLLEAIKLTQSTETDAIIRALEDMTFHESIYGSFKFRKEDHQALIDVGFVKLEPKQEPPGWGMAEFIRLPAADNIEPAGPGQKYVYD